MKETFFKKIQMFFWRQWLKIINQLINKTFGNQSSNHQIKIIPKTSHKSWIAGYKRWKQSNNN